MVKFESPGTRAKVLRQGTPAEHNKIEGRPVIKPWKIEDYPVADRWYWDLKRRRPCFAIKDDGEYLLVKHYGLALDSSDHNPAPHSLLPLFVRKDELVQLTKAVEFQL